MRRGVAAGAQPVALEDRRAEADGRRLAVGPDHVDRGEAALRQAQHGHQPVHAVEPEAHAEQLEREQVLLGLAEGHSDPRRRSASRYSSSLRRSSRHHLGGRALDELARWRACARRARSPRAAARAGRRGGARPRPGRRRRRAAPARRRRAPARSPARRRWRVVLDQLEAREPRQVVAQPLVAVGDAGARAAPPTAWPRPRRGSGAASVTASISRPTSASASRRRSRDLVRDRPVGHGQQAALPPRASGISDQISSVTNGITGCSSRSVRSSAHSSTAETALVVVVVEARLGELEVPVAQLRPERAVEVERGVREAEAVEQLRHARGQPLQARHDPAVLDGGGRARRRARPRPPAAGSGATRSRACWRGRGPA